MHHGNVTRRSLRVKNKNDARRLEALLHLQIAKGELGQKEVPALNIFYKQFINYLPGRVKPETYRAYTGAVRRLLAYPPLEKARLDEIDGALLDQFIQKCRADGLAVATVNLTLRVLSKLLRLAVEWRLLDHAPKIHKLPGENQREYTISEADEARLIDASPHPTMKALIPFLIDTGLRIGEACALTWGDVRDGTVNVKTGKTKLAKRTIPLTKRAVAVLDAILTVRPDGPAPVFTRHGGKAISAIWATKHFVTTRRQLGLPDGCVLHTTRHTFCTRLGKAGASAFELQRLAGHAGITISARYCHPDEEQLTRAIDRLNKEPK